MNDLDLTPPLPKPKRTAAILLIVLGLVIAAAAWAIDYKNEIEPPEERERSISATCSEFESFGTDYERCIRREADAWDRSRSIRLMILGGLGILISLGASVYWVRDRMSSSA